MHFKPTFILILLGVGHIAESQSFYGNVITANAKAYALASDVIGDLKTQLAQATGQNFSINTKDTTSETGIHIVALENDGKIYDRRLDPNNADAVLLRSDGNHTIQIVAYTRQGLINGIYSYLDTLGFRWYQPGEAWAYVPTLKDIRIKLDEVLVPDFALRTFFGTWGTPRNKVVDKKALVDQQWQVWALRNRMGGAYTLKGHAWNEFLWRNYSPLNDHREMMALVNGERVAPNTAAKFCISNKDFQALFVKDMVAQLQKMMTANPGQSAYCVSVEPSDGEGFCECGPCKKLGSISNQVFFLANVVAKEFQKISPNAYVNLYAYNTHAAPPDFNLEPNVLVQIIPYGYQHFSSPQEMFAAWKKKNCHLFIYDYYGLPIDNIDMPLTGDLKPLEFAKRIKYWHAQNIMGATLESSYSIGATGPGLYLFARLGWNVNGDAQKILNDYYNHCYGKAAKAVQDAQQLLAGDTMGKECDLALAMLAIKKQANKPEGKEKTCLIYYEGYLHYLKLLYNVQKEDPEIEPAASDSLMRFVYGIFQTMMVHQFPVNEYLKGHGPAKDYIKTHWDTFKPTAEGMKYAEVVPLTNAQIEASFERDCGELKK